MKRSNKRGQFYLLSAIVIITIIIGFAAISSYSKEKSSVRLYDLKEELGIESAEVIESGISQGKEMSNLTLHFSGIYTDFAGENKNMYFIIGDQTGVSLYSYTDIIGGTISINYGEGYSTLEIINKEMTKTDVTPQDGKEKIVAVIEDVEYEFELKQGENFYFVVVQEIEGEKYVVTS